MVSTQLDSYFGIIEERVTPEGYVASIFTGADTYGVSSTRALVAWTSSDTVLTVTLGVGEGFTADDTISLTGVADLAGNSITLSASSWT